MNAERTVKEGDIPVPAKVGLTLLAFWAVIHAIRSRTLADYVRYSLYIAAPIAAVSLVVLLYQWWQSRFRRPSGDEVLTIVFTPFGLLLVGAFYYSIAVAIKDTYLWVQAPTLSRNGAVALGLSLTLGAGLLLFYFRLRLRSIYGVSESLVGLTVAGHRVATQPDTAISDSGFYLAVLTAGVYLVVRGLDNVHQGLTKPPLDPIAERVLSWLRRRSPESVALRRAAARAAIHAP